MAKRIKRIKKGVESLREEVDKHFLKLERDIEEGNLDMGRYHFKEIDKSLLFALENKIEFPKVSNEIVEFYRKKLDKLRVKLGLDKAKKL